MFQYKDWDIHPIPWLTQQNIFRYWSPPKQEANSKHKKT